MTQNELLAKENRLLDSFLQRHSSDGVNDLTVSSGSFHRDRSPRSGVSGVNRRHPNSRQTTQEPQLSDGDRLRIAQDEYEYRSKQLNGIEYKAKEDVSLLRSIIEGLKIRMNELRKETYEFQRDIVLGSENPRTGFIEAERVIRYFEEKLKEKGHLYEKLKLKNKYLRNYRLKMEYQVKSKEEQGDSLHSIDFHQLQIKNSQFNAKIKERNEELLRLKMTTGKTIQVLNEAKRNLNEFLVYSKNLKREMKEKENGKYKLGEELTRVLEEVKKEEKKNRKFKVQQSNPEMPQVLDYVNQKSKGYELENGIKNWRRKLEISEMSVKAARRIMEKARQEGIDVNAIVREVEKLNGKNRAEVKENEEDGDEEENELMIEDRTHHSVALPPIRK